MNQKFYEIKYINERKHRNNMKLTNIAKIRETLRRTGGRQKGGNIGCPRFFCRNHKLSCNRRFNPTYCYVCSAVELVSFRNYSTNGRRTDEHTCVCSNTQSVFEHTKVCCNTLLCVRTHFCVIEYSTLHKKCIVTSYTLLWRE